jgi:hypothetical protein
MITSPVMAVIRDANHFRDGIATPPPVGGWGIA